MSADRTPRETPDQERERMMAQVESSARGMISLYREVVSTYGELSDPKNAIHLERLSNSLTVALLAGIHNFDRATTEEMGISILEAFYGEVVKVNPAAAGAIMIRITAKLAMLRMVAFNKQFANRPDLTGQGIEDLRKAFEGELTGVTAEQKPQEKGARPQFIKTIKVGEAIVKIDMIERLMKYHSASREAILEAFPNLRNTRCVMVSLRESVSGGMPVLIMEQFDQDFRSLTESSLIDPYTGNPRSRVG